MFYNGNSSIDGVGSFASVNIPRGHLIHSEKPFLYLRSDEVPVSPQGPQDPQWQTWQTWLGLRPPGTPLHEIFRTTSIRCGVVRSGNQKAEIWGVFLQAVRFNSSCEPNIHAHWNETGGCMEFRALRDIAVDEELCHCYDPPTLLYSTADRQHRLRSKFGFHCKCTTCSQNSPSSDQRRTELRRRIEAGVPTTPSSTEAGVPTTPSSAKAASTNHSSAKAASTNHRVETDQIDSEKLRNFISQKTSAIADLYLAGLHHYADTLHYDLYVAQMRLPLPNNGILCLLTARNLTRVMVGNSDGRVDQMTAMLPPHLQNDYGLVCRAGCCELGMGLANSLPPSPNIESKPAVEMRDHTNGPKTRAAYWVAEQEDTHVDSPNTVGGPPISPQDDMDIDKPDAQAEILAVKREETDTDEPNTLTTGVIQTQGSAQPTRPSPDPNTLQLTSAFEKRLTLRESPQLGSKLATSLVGTVASVAHAIAQPVLNRISKGMLKSTRTESPSFSLRKSQSMQVDNPTHELSSSFREIEGLEQLRTVPDKPLVPFLEIAHMLSKRVLGMARSSNIHTTQKVYIARQAMHLLVLLNDSVDMEDPESTQEEEEGIELEDELRAFAKTLKISDEEDSAELDEFHQKFYRPRRYFKNNRGGEADSLYSKLKAYDIRTREMKGYQKELNTGPPMSGEERSPPVGDTEAIDERHEDGQEPTSSANVQPVSSRTRARVAQMEM